MPPRQFIWWHGYAGMCTGAVSQWGIQLGEGVETAVEEMAKMHKGHGAEYRFYRIRLLWASACEATGQSWWL